MKYINLDSITDITEGIIAHQVNCQDRIGAGVSGAIIRKYPGVERMYHRWCESFNTPKKRFGTVQLLTVKDIPHISIANIFTQMHYGNAKKTGIKYTDEGRLIQKIVTLCREYPCRKIYIPEYIGCGLAGGDWNYVSSKLNDENLSNLHIVHRGVVAQQ